MSIDLKKCDKSCHTCVYKYISKHNLKKGDSFKIACSGIPEEYISPSLAASIGEDLDVAKAMFDPVTWAAKFLDWHCLDPKGEIWKRKTEEGTIPTGLPGYNEKIALAGKSIFHRPYQALMMRCSSKRRVLRCGRQIGKTEILCLSILFNIFTHNNFKVVLIAPYQSQIDLIFKRLTDYINNNTLLSNSIQRNVKAPSYQVVLKNGSVVTGFTAGTKSGQDAGASRGQSANMLVFDEADMLSAGDIDAALAIITNFPEATVWMSSTPTGKRERFYKTCYDKQFKEFHFSSHVNPNWTEDLDEMFKSNLTTHGYKHEILAEFGEQEEGVYQHKYIIAAKTDYKYGDIAPRADWIFTIGVDWNDVKIGTTIAVTAFDPVNQLFYLVDKHIISREERTQLTACEKITELNRYWNPQAIYVDKGYGSSQIEILKEYGYKALQQYGSKHPDAKIYSILKPYDFGGAIDTYDLVTKQLIKKPAKPFLVENAVRRFEQYRFKYPQSDTNFTEQLQGYVVDRVTQTGRFVYKAQNESVGDHFLDAVNLSLVAFTLEKTDFGKPKFSSEIAFASNPLQSQESKTRHSSMGNKSFGSRPIERTNDILVKRANKVIQNLEGSFPGSNTALAENQKLWSNPGWESDTEHKFKSRKKGSPFRPRMGARPSRKKF